MFENIQITVTVSQNACLYCCTMVPRIAVFLVAGWGVDTRRLPRKQMADEGRTYKRAQTCGSSWGAAPLTYSCRRSPSQPRRSFVSRHVHIIQCSEMGCAQLLPALPLGLAAAPQLNTERPSPSFAAGNKMVHVCHVGRFRERSNTITSALWQMCNLQMTGKKQIHAI